jgi:amphi-Trp domain-containing protein
MSEEDDHDEEEIEETVHEVEGARSRGAIASFLLRAASAFDRGKPVPVGEDVAVDPPEEPEFEVELEREDGELSLEFEVEWPEEDGDVQTESESEAESEESNATFELYEDSAEEWRWRLRHDNGNIIADSGEGYTRKADAQNGLESVKQNAPGAPVEQQE